MPVVRRGDEHGVDVLGSSTFRKSSEGLRAPLRHRDALLPERLIDIANGNGVYIGLFEEIPPILPAAPAVPISPIRTRSFAPQIREALNAFAAVRAQRPTREKSLLVMVFLGYSSAGLQRANSAPGQDGSGRFTRLGATSYTRISYVGNVYLMFRLKL